MKRIVLDHFRRRAWVFALGALAQIALGWAQAATVAKHGENLFGTLQFQLGGFLGSFLLMLDLQRGVARALTVLPLSAAHIGRGWWMATVAVPAAFFCTLMALGVALYHTIHPNIAVAWSAFTGSVLTLVLVLGAGFTLMFHMVQGAAPGQGWKRSLNMLAGLFWFLLIGGGIQFLGKLPDHPERLAALLVAGVTLTVFGWFRTEAFARDRAGFRVAPESGRRDTNASTPARRTRGLDGMPLFIVQNAGRAFLIGLAMILIPVAVSVLSNRTQSWEKTWANTATFGQTPFTFVLIFTLVPALTQLRHLRTLPLSSSRLALVLLTLFLLPLLALGGLSTAISGWTLGEQAALRSLQSYLLMLPSAALFLAFITWLGLRTTAYLLFVFAMILTQVGTLWLSLGKPRSPPPLPFTLLATAAVLVLAFFLVRLFLRRGTRTYQAATMGAFAPNWS